MSESPIRISRRTPAREPLSVALSRRAFASRLTSLEHGELECVEGDRAMRFGERFEDGLFARVEVRDPRFYRRVVLGGDIGGVEAYLDGDWDTPDPVAVCRVLVRNESALEGLGRGVASLARGVERIRHRARRNSRSGSRRNIRAHYDVGNDFYALFLDETLTYSAGIFEREGATLEEAARAKYERLCRKLALRPGDHVLEIGSGWGGFAIHAAREHGCRVTTTTVSEAQHGEACERVAKAGLSDRVEVLLEDYRDLRGTYDKLVSIEMIEAVGHEYLETYFGVCDRRLAGDGLAAIQAITTPDQRYEASRRGTDFIKRFVFPGGQLPSVGAMVATATAAGSLRLVHVEDITPHYAKTLALWRQRLLENAASARALGYDAGFLRLWDFYLAACEACFAERYTGDLQLVFAKPGNRRGPILGSLA